MSFDKCIHSCNNLLHKLDNLLFTMIFTPSELAYLSAYHMLHTVLRGTVENKIFLILRMQSLIGKKDQKIGIYINFNMVSASRVNESTRSVVRPMGRTHLTELEENWGNRLKEVIPKLGMKEINEAKRRRTRISGRRNRMCQSRCRE